LTKTFVVLGDTATDRFGFCLVLMAIFLSVASESILDASVGYDTDRKTKY
jgi:hypothetical protein